MDYTDIQPLLNAYYNKRMGLQKDIANRRKYDEQVRKTVDECGSVSGKPSARPAFPFSLYFNTPART